MSEDIPAWMLEFARCEPHIRAALKYSAGSHTVEDVVLEVASGGAQFWPGQESVIVTKVIQYPQHKSLHFWLAGGDLHELEAMHAQVEEWGKAQGCTHSTIVGRKGWERTFLRDRGFTPQSVVFSKEL
jgi:hypothetical protein